MSQNPSRWLQQGGRDPQAEIRARLNKILEQQEIDLAEEQLQGVIKKARETAKRKEQIRKMEGQLKTAQATEKVYPLYAARQTKERGVRSAEMWRQALEELKGTMQPSPEARYGGAGGGGGEAEPAPAEPQPAPAPAEPSPVTGAEQRAVPYGIERLSVIKSEMQALDKEILRLNTEINKPENQADVGYMWEAEKELNRAAKQKRNLLREQRGLGPLAQWEHEEDLAMMAAQAEEAKRLEEEARAIAFAAAKAGAIETAKVPAKVAMEEEKARIQEKVAAEKEASSKRLAAYKQELAKPGIDVKRTDTLNKLVKAEYRAFEAQLAKELIAEKEVWKGDWKAYQAELREARREKFTIIQIKLREIMAVQVAFEKAKKPLPPEKQEEYDNLMAEHKLAIEAREQEALDFLDEKGLSAYVARKEKAYKKAAKEAFEGRVEEYKEGEKKFKESEPPSARFETTFEPTPAPVPAPTSQYPRSKPTGKYTQKQIDDAYDSKTWDENWTRVIRAEVEAEEWEEEE